MILDGQTITLANVPRWREQLEVDAAGVGAGLAARVDALEALSIPDPANVFRFADVDRILTNQEGDVLVGVGGNVLLGA